MTDNKCNRNTSFIFKINESFKMRSLTFTLVAIVTTSIIIGIDMSGINTSKKAYAQIQARQSDLVLSNLIKQGQPYQGSKSSHVSLIMFGDFQCHDCDRFVKYTGKVALVFVHIPNKGFDSWPAALAAQCANDQGKFWQSTRYYTIIKDLLTLGG
jgi:protein-disulfide isomerase